MTNKYQVAAYYFPNYHLDTKNIEYHGEGWTEWELVKRAEPRFKDHRQPRVPAWGYGDEADPEVMAMKIDAAADHGLTAFLFDWYWHKEGPFLHRCLEEGFLKARNNERLKFALMWANHDWIDIHPATRHRQFPTLFSGEVDEQTFIDATNHIINTYFGHSSYWRVNGGLYFSFYELMSLVKGFESLEETRRILNGFRERVRAAGLGELHLNAVVYGIQILPGEKKVTEPNEMLEILGFDSVTSYVWIHHTLLPDFPKTSYSWCREEARKNFDTLTRQFKLPYYPNVTMGWDASPRTIQSDRYDNLGYPFMSTLGENTPEEFEKALWQAREFLDRGLTNPPILTLNAWNEWTEGSYLEPDTVYGMSYLKAIQRVFGSL